MRVHHLDCCTMCPVGAPFAPAKMVAHCLLVETPKDGLVLVDTGIGIADVRAPKERLGAGFVAVARPRCDDGQPAAAQIDRLGFRREDVRHVLVTHLDLDHAGGLPDFPKARVHVHAKEHDVATAQRSMMERARYRPCHWAHGPEWTLYDREGEPWMGLPAVRALEGLPPEILAVPTHGHSVGHCAIAVKRDDGKWLLHAGDSYFGENTMDRSKPPLPGGLKFFERMAAAELGTMRATQARLRELRRDHGDEIRMFSAHDPAEFARFA